MNQRDVQKMLSQIVKNNQQNRAQPITAKNGKPIKEQTGSYWRVNGAATNTPNRREPEPILKNNDDNQTP